MRRILSFVAACIMIGMTILPEAAAQLPMDIQAKVGLENGLTEGRLRPETPADGIVEATITIPPAAVCTEPIEVVFAVFAVPGYASITIVEPKHSFTVLPAPYTQWVDVASEFRLETTRDAPAYYDSVYDFRVEVRSSGNVTCPLQGGIASAGLLVRNDYVAGLEIGDATIHHDELYGSVEVPVKNTANGPTRVVAVLDGTDRAPFVSLNAQDLLLESENIRGPPARDEGILRIAYLLDNVESAPLNVRFVAAHDHLASDMASITAKYVAVGTLPPTRSASPVASQNDVDIAQAPAPDLAVLLLVTALVGALLRRRRA